MQTGAVQSHATAATSQNQSKANAKQSARPKSQSSGPQDKVTISSAAQSKPTPAAGPKAAAGDHDGDKK
jgi:hypothetical protein